jgi:transposase
MNKHSENVEIRVLGIDLAKSSFQLHGVDGTGKRVINKKMTAEKLKAFLINLPPCLVGMEACAGAHYWARLFQRYGHDVRLMAPQFVKPYVKSNKNDAADAEAICEAVQRPGMRFVAIKSVEQLDIQAIHRMRSLAVDRRTAQINQIRGLLLEHGITIRVGRDHFNKALPEILEDAENGLSDLMRGELALLRDSLQQMDERVAHYDALIEQMAQADQRAQWLLSIPGVGAKAATALLAAIGDISAFKNGRELAAWLGLVPRQHSTGGKSRLLGISKRGDVYLRQLLIHGARAVLQHVERKTDRTSRWATVIKARRPNNIATVALANKMARTAFALLKNEQMYRAVP